MACRVLPVISTHHIVFVVAKTINCDEHCMKIGAHFLTDSILQPTLPTVRLTLVAWEYRTVSTEG